MERVRKIDQARVVACLTIGLLLAVETASANQGKSEHAPAAVRSAHSHGDPAAHEAHATHPGNATDSAMPGAEMAWPTADGAGPIHGEPEHPATFGARLLAWFGAWHPAVIHFPIALPVTVGLLELLAWSRRTPRYVANNQILLGVAVAGAFVAASFGWAGAGLPSAEDDWAMTIHRGLGSTIPFLLLLLWNAGRLSVPTVTGSRSRSYCVLLVVSVLLILTQGFLGGEVTHGANHMAF